MPGQARSKPRNNRTDVPAKAAGFLSKSKCGLRLASELVEHREVIERKRYAERARDFPGERKRFLYRFAGRGKDSRDASRSGKVCAAEDAHIDAVDL
jgi:hypothetical protein